MSGEKYIGLDVHQATICAAVMDPMGKVIIESILETKAATILEFFAGLHGTLSVNVRRRNLGGLALRSAQTACGQLSGVQPETRASGKPEVTCCKQAMALKPSGWAS
jgi:hypothetical protein